MNDVDRGRRRDLHQSCNLAIHAEPHTERGPTGDERRRKSGKARLD